MLGLLLLVRDFGMKKKSYTITTFGNVDSFQNVTKRYLYYYLEKDATKIKNEVQGGTMVHITKGDMEKRAITYPCVEEQKKIAKLLSLFDERIATQHKIIDKLQSLIKGIRVRLVQIEKYSTV